MLNWWGSQISDRQQEQRTYYEYQAEVIYHQSKELILAAKHVRRGLIEKSVVDESNEMNFKAHLIKYFNQTFTAKVLDEVIK